MLSLLFLASCQPESVEETDTQKQEEFIPEQISAERLSKPFKTNYAGEELYVAEVDGVYVHQGDILIPETGEEIKVYEKGLVPAQKAAARQSGYWEDNTVYYILDSRLQSFAIDRVNESIAWFEANTNINFVNEAHSDGYIFVTAGHGCSSYVGKIGGTQRLSIGNGFEYWITCPTGSITHEFMHAIGFWHEHMRLDRDKYVDIFWENMVSGAEYNYQMISPTRDMDIGDKLDYNSIMMYGSLSFSKNGEYTMLKKDGSVLPYNRTAPSAKDLEAINMLYPDNSEPEYQELRWYVVHGLRVWRWDSRWWYYTRYGFREVKYSTTAGYWYFA